MSDATKPPAADLRPASRRGRPRAKEPGSALLVWLPTSDYDRLIQAASAHRMSVSSLVRVLLQMDLGSKS